MKRFVTTFVALTLTLANGDTSLKFDNFQSNNNIPAPIYTSQQQQNIIRNSFLKPNGNFLSQPENQHQIQTQLKLQPKYKYLIPDNQQQKKFGQPLAISADFPTKIDFRMMINANPTHRYRPRTRIPKKAIVTKHFYLHSAPEETQAEIEEELAALQQQQQQQPRKHYNVLFVKTPSPTNKAAALHLANVLKEEKTVVYVLSKKTTAADLQDAIDKSPKQSSKPEVFFIKYRTPEEAENAQHQVQAQYESLGGSTFISDEGVAPVTSVIGSLDAVEEIEEEPSQPNHQLPEDKIEEQLLMPAKVGTSQELVNNLPASVNNGYLPPSKSTLI